MNLKSKLAAIREASAERIPEATRATMHAQNDSLKASGITERALAAGAAWPAFELPSADGSAVRSAALLEQGPLVVTFFRGHW